MKLNPLGQNHLSWSVIVFCGCLINSRFSGTLSQQRQTFPFNVAHGKLAFISFPVFVYSHRFTLVGSGIFSQGNWLWFQRVSYDVLPSDANSDPISFSHWVQAIVLTKSCGIKRPKMVKVTHCFQTKNRTKACCVYVTVFARRQLWREVIIHFCHILFPI